MDLFTCASRLLHKCHENDTIYVLKQQNYFCCVAAVGINDSGISCAV